MSIFSTQTDTDYCCVSTIYELDPFITPKIMNTKLVTQGNFMDAVRTLSFIVGSVDSTGTLSFAQNPAYHTTPAAARAECKRLAKVSPGKLYMFVRLDGGEMVPTTSISI